MIDIQLKADARRRNADRYTPSARPVNQLKEKTLTSYSFDKLVKHAHKYAKAIQGDRDFPLVERTDEGYLRMSKEIREHFGFEYTCLCGTVSASFYTGIKPTQDRPNLIKVIRHLYTLA